MPSFLPSTPQLVLLAAMGMMIWVLWRRSHKHFGRGGKAYESPHRVSQIEDNRELALSDAPPELSRWQVEMYELSRDLKGEIDTKLALLEVLTRNANEACARLEKATQHAERLGITGERDLLGTIESWQPDAACSPTPAPLPQADKIYALAAQGASAASIAATTGLSLGDVEITLSLREQD